VGPDALLAQSLKSELLIRQLICDLVGDEATRQSIGHRREAITVIEARLEDAEGRAAELPTGNAT
jgi:hypothetical protein